MKKVSLFLAALALVLGISQCKKQEDPVGGKLVTQKVTFTTSFGDGSKLCVTEGTDEAAGTLNLSWEVDDKIKVTDGAGHESELTCTKVSSDGLTGTFEGEITYGSGQLTFTVGTEPDYKNQHFTAITTNEIYLVGESGFVQSGDYNVGMALPYAILKVDLAELAPESGSNDVSVKIGDEEIAKVTNVSENAHQVYLLLPLQSAGETTLEFTDGTNTITKTYPLAPNGFYSAGGTGGFALIEPFKFTVSAGPDGRYGTEDDVTVTFAPGNLYYDGSESKWKFEAHQWDFRTYEGGGAVIDGSTTITETGDWGLFGWSSTASNYGMKTRKPEGEGDNWEIDYEGDFVEWGGNVIGTDAANTWRTLTKAEWVFLIGNDDDLPQEPEPCRDNASSLRAWKELDGGHKGLVILPDGTNASVMNSITTLAHLATYGAVFLPASGYRLGTVIHDVGVQGNCWASSLTNSFPNYFYFSHAAQYPIRPSASGNRFYGQSVRLVKED